MLYKLTVAICIAAASAFSGDAVLSKFEAWKREYNKSYSSPDELAKALKAFAAADAKIEEHNAKGLSWTLGHNEFSDLTPEEFLRPRTTEIYKNYRPANVDRVHLKGIGKPLADSVDWVAKGAVTPVKNQAQCGSCWAFSTTGAMEGAYQIATGKLMSFSEEDLVECDHNGDQGCQGGLMDNAFTWIKSNGICTESAYPYTSGSGQTGVCKKTCSPVATNTGHSDVPTGDEDALKAAVAKHPVSVAIEADKSAFQSYKGGVLDNPACGKQLDHGVLVVGYGTDEASGKEYWKVKNSWGASWGEEGYIRMVKGKNQCGIAQQPSYPTGVKAMGPSPPSPTPPTPPTPPSPYNPTHYGDPKTTCRPDEAAVTIQGIDGDFCTPKCFPVIKPCPTDLPTGVTAQAQCALQDSSTGEMRCALVCSATALITDQKAADAQCGTNASCKSLQLGLGVCTYDD